MTTRKTVDARGLLCPMPLIQTRKALRELTAGDELEVLLDNETARCNVERFLADNGVPHATRVEGALIRLTVRLDRAFGEAGGGAASEAGTDRCEPVATAAGSASRSGAGRHVVNLRSERMGDGPDELGAILMQAFVNTLRETSPLPSAITMYNSGVKLARADSPVVSSLRELESAGVRILVCGTCVNYFAMRDQVGVGVVSNMFDILTALSGASHVVSP